MGHPYMPIKMAKIQNTDSTIGKNVGRATGTPHLFLMGRWYSHFGRHFGSFFFFFLTKPNIISSWSSYWTPWYNPIELETYIPTKTYAQMFSAALLTIVKIWKPRYLLIGECIKTVEHPDDTILLSYIDKWAVKLLWHGEILSIYD